MINAKLDGDVKFARLKTPVETKFGKEVYQLTMTTTQEKFDALKTVLKVMEDVDLEKFKIPHKVQDDGSVDVYFQIRASGTKKDGEVFDKAPKVVDTDDNRVDAGKLGKGSKVKTEFIVFTYEFKKPDSQEVVTGMQLQPKKLIVTDLVKYEVKKPVIDGDF